MAVATFLGLVVVLWKRSEARVRRALLYVCSLVFGCVLSFPVVYGAVRYLPPVFHHPIWFGGEYSEWKVHSWDPYDSEKYTDWRDVIQGNFGRLFPDIANADLSLRATGQEIMFTEAFDDYGKGGMPYGSLNGISLSEQDERPPVSKSVQKWKISVSGAASVRPQISGKTGGYFATDTFSRNGFRQASVMKSSIEARFGIYRHYFSRMNLWGHKDAENGFQYSESYYAPHAHNIFLQYAFNYGLPAGIVFFVYLVASGIRLWTLSIRDESGTPFLLGLLLLSAIATFGMTEIVWRYGQLSHTLLLLLPCFAWQHVNIASGKAA